MKIQNQEQKIFSADDWGFSPGINEGILDLARQKKLFSVSCSANAPYLLHGLEELLSFADKGVRFHIHFNLTYGKAASSVNYCPNLVGKNGEFYNFNIFTMKGILGLLPSFEVLTEFRTQMKILKEKNVPITGLDGHHHIHLFPFVYNSIKNEFKKNEIQYVRLMTDVQHPASFLQSLFFKRFIFKEEEFIDLCECGYLLPENLKNREEFEKKLKKFQRVLVHPAQYNDFAESGMSDALQGHRVHELNCIKDLYCE